MESNQNNTFSGNIPFHQERPIQHREDVTIDVSSEVSPSKQQTGDHKQSANFDSLTPPNPTIRSGNPYHSGYDQDTLSEVQLHHPPFSSWTVERNDAKQEKVSDLRLFGAISILFNLGFGISALIQAVRAREEYEKGNITRAKELNSSALGLGIAGIAISLFVGVIVVVQHLLF